MPRCDVFFLDCSSISEPPVLTSNTPSVALGGGGRLIVSHPVNDVERMSTVALCAKGSLHCIGLFATHGKSSTCGLGSSVN